MSEFIKKFLAGVSGATAIEYGLIAAGISLAIVSVVFLFGDELAILFESLRPAAQAMTDNIETGR